MELLVSQLAWLCVYRLCVLDVCLCLIFRELLVRAFLVARRRRRGAARLAMCDMACVREVSRYV